MRTWRKRGGIAGALALATALAACQPGELDPSRLKSRYDAAEGVAAFVQAARSGDKAAFEKHVDRPKLRGEVRAQLLASAKGQANASLRQALANGRADALLDGLIQPSSFQLESVGLLGGGGAPSAANLALELRPVEGGRVCLPSAPGQGCALTFAKEAGTWKLVAMNMGAAHVVTLPTQDTTPKG